MAIAQLVFQILIFLGIVYVAFIQERISKTKDTLWKTVKDFPDIAEKRFEWKEENIRQEAKVEVEKKLQEFASEAKKGIDFYLKEIRGDTSLIYDLIWMYADYSYFSDAIKRMDETLGKPIYLQKLQERQKELKEKNLDDPRSRLIREISYNDWKLKKLERG